MKKITEISEKKNLREILAGENVKIYDFVNLYECVLGDDTQIGAFVEIQKNVKIGKRCRIQSHTFICEGVTIEDDVFIGHGVMFINDKHPSAVGARNKTWEMLPVMVKRGASIGTGAIILGGVVIGENAIIGAGAVVTKDVPCNEVHVGMPARNSINIL